jgi:hypothetical protein
VEIWLFAGNVLIGLVFLARVREHGHMLDAVHNSPHSGPIDWRAAFVAERQAHASEREAHELTREALASLKAAFERLQIQVATLVRQRFGSSSENADQLAMFGSADVEVIEQKSEPKAPITPKSRPAERQRVVLPQGLPEERVEVDVPAEQKVAADGTPLKRIGEETTVKLGYRAAMFFKKVIVRPERSEVSEANIRRSAPARGRRALRKAAVATDRGLAARCQPGCAPSGSEVRRSPAAVPDRGDLLACRCGHPAQHAERLGDRAGGVAEAAAHAAEGAAVRAAGDPRRRDGVAAAVGGPDDQCAGLGLRGARSEDRAV